MVANPLFVYLYIEQTNKDMNGDKMETTGYTTNYSLYLYKDGGLKLYNGGRPRKKFTSIREAIEYAQRRIAKLKSISKPEFYEFYRNQQILVVEYTDSWKSRVRGVLTDEGKCYTEIPLPVNPEV